MNDFTKNKNESKILIVDDNPANVKLLEKILKINGYTNIETLTDARQALILYEEFDPDLMLLDLKMPYFDGFSIMEFLKDEVGLVYLPVIVITAQNDKQNRMRALELGAQDFIGKPFDTAEVVLRVGNFLDIRTINKELFNKNTMLETSVSEKEKKLEQMHTELIERLLIAVEFRDQDTGEHISRIKKYVEALSKKLGFSEEVAQNVGNASLMHDIGKIGVPDNVLNKKGKLDNKEWENMKEHTVKGAHILKGSNSNVIKLAEEIALTHHEKWDGSGYPNGLSGANIPLPGRIVALVDVFDALISDRTYKKAWEINDAVDYIKSQRGKHFDPLVVDMFIENLNEFIKIANSKE